jgi:hypothetical protein
MRTLLFAICLCIATTHSGATTETTTETLKSAAEKAAQASVLAKKGEYGRLSAAQINMILEARNRIERLAMENSSIEDFDASERRIYDHAIERINRVTRSTDKQRMVCKKVVKTGTRLVESECLTVAQREARAKSSRDRTDQIQRAGCNNFELQCSGGG